MKILYCSLTLLLILSQIIIFPANSYANDVHISAKSAILIDQESGRILFEKEAYTKRRIASITKIMTAIIAIESGKLNDKVKIHEHSTHIEGSSIYLEHGEILTLKDLVYGLMLRSGNDAAVAIAHYIGGSVEGFVFLMNQKAKELGMNDTNFANPHGLDDNNDHYSTAYDMAMLTQYAMKNETFREIFGTKNYKSFTLDGEKKLRYWKNKHKLVTGLYKHTTGGKTGYTKKAKRTLVSTAHKNNMTLIAVTLDAPDDWNDHITMFEYAFEQYDRVKLVDNGKYKHIDNPFYKNNLRIKNPIFYPLTDEERQQLTSTLILYKPPKKDEWVKYGIPEPVGRLNIQINNHNIASVPLFFDGNPINAKESFIKKIKNILD